MPDIGIPELLIILAVVVLLFGSKKLPELARSLGRSSSEFKKGLREGAATDDSAPAPKATPGPDATDASTE
jgi:sec-independent protein translocase protein TatA